MLEIRLNGDSFPLGMKERMNWGMLTVCVLIVLLGGESLTRKRLYFSISGSKLFNTSKFCSALYWEIQ